MVRRLHRRIELALPDVDEADAFDERRTGLCALLVVFQRDALSAVRLLKSSVRKVNAPGQSVA